MCFKCLEVVVMGLLNPLKAIYIMHMLQGYDVAEWFMPITRSSLIKSNIRCISHCAYSLATRCQFLLKYVTSYTNIFAIRYLYKYLFQICIVLYSLLTAISSMALNQFIKSQNISIRMVLQILSMESSSKMAFVLAQNWQKHSMLDNNISDNHNEQNIRRLSKPALL